MRWYSFFALTLLSIVQTANAADPKDRDTIQGTWAASSVEFGGKPFPEEIRKSIKLTLKDDKYTVNVGPNLDQGTIKLDPSAKPKAMDIVGTEGPNKNKTFQAIYELDGNTLRICYDLSGQSRPTAFKTSEGTQLFLVTYNREKP